MGSSIPQPGLALIPQLLPCSSASAALFLKVCSKEHCIRNTGRVGCVEQRLGILKEDLAICKTCMAERKGDCAHQLRAGVHQSLGPWQVSFSKPEYIQEPFTIGLGEEGPLMLRQENETS